jgi:predicted nuclease of restriction endonuclease-like (RecB) superfamily
VPVKVPIGNGPFCRESLPYPAFAVNRELVRLYWSIGREISQRFDREDWGGKIVDRLAKDLQAEFPAVEGFSPRSLRYMRSFAEAWPDELILQQAAAKLPWGHHMVLLDRVKQAEVREWYLRAALEHGWSRNVLVHMISGQLHEREGRLSQTLSELCRLWIPIWPSKSSRTRTTSIF